MFWFAVWMCAFSKTNQIFTENEAVKCFIFVLRKKQIDKNKRKAPYNECTSSRINSAIYKELHFSITDLFRFWPMTLLRKVFVFISFNWLNRLMCDDRNLEFVFFFHLYYIEHIERITDRKRIKIRFLSFNIYQEG